MQRYDMHIFNSYKLHQPVIYLSSSGKIFNTIYIYYILERKKGNKIVIDWFSIVKVQYKPSKRTVNTNLFI